LLLSSWLLSSPPVWTKTVAKYPQFGAFYRYLYYIL
jgi:hypothetical protein